MFFKTDELRWFDEDFGDPSSEAKDMTSMICSQLEDDIIDHVMHLREAFDALADLDVILSFAGVSLAENYTRPLMVSSEEDCILIKNGSHPLIDKLLNREFKRNDTEIERDSRLCIVTGPNFSGKSCYARQVGLLVYMAHLGCFIPCEAARISVVDQIVAQFSTVESCNMPQSSFQLDLTRMGGILQRATSSSLVLIDEFGKGTSPTSGIALLMVALQRLGKIGCKVVCTTHFLEIFSMKLAEEGKDGFAAVQMAIRFPDNDHDIPEPLFHLEPGVAQSSAGVACAKMSGVKESVVARAAEIISVVKRGEKAKPLSEIIHRRLKSPQVIKDALSAVYGKQWQNVSDANVMEYHGRMTRLTTCLRRCGEDASRATGGTSTVA